MIFYDYDTKKFQVIGISSRHTLNTQSCGASEDNAFVSTFSKENLKWIDEITGNDFCQAPDLMKKESHLCERCKFRKVDSRIYNGEEVKIIIL